MSTPATTTTTTTTTASTTWRRAPSRQGPTVLRLVDSASWVRTAPVRLQAALAEERGDVPGWVLVTLMTAGLVLAIYGIASPALQGVFNRAIESVSGVR